MVLLKAEKLNFIYVIPLINMFYDLYWQIKSQIIDVLYMPKFLSKLVSVYFSFNIFYKITLINHSTEVLSGVYFIDYYQF